MQYTKAHGIRIHSGYGQNISIIYIESQSNDRQNNSSAFRQEKSEKYKAKNEIR